VLGSVVAVRDQLPGEPLGVSIRLSVPGMPPLRAVSTADVSGAQRNARRESRGVTITWTAA
jgi:hypothetical protein